MATQAMRTGRDVAWPAGVPKPFQRCDGMWELPLWTPDGGWELSEWWDDTPIKPVSRKACGKSKCDGLHLEDIAEFDRKRARAARRVA